MRELARAEELHQRVPLDVGVVRVEAVVQDRLDEVACLQRRVGREPDLPRIPVRAPPLGAVLRGEVSQVRRVLAGQVEALDAVDAHRLGLVDRLRPVGRRGQSVLPERDLVDRVERGVRRVRHTHRDITDVRPVERVRRERLVVVVEPLRDVLRHAFDEERDRRAARHLEHVGGVSGLRGVLNRRHHVGVTGALLHVGDRDVRVLGVPEVDLGLLARRLAPERQRHGSGARRCRRCGGTITAAGA